MTKNTFYLILAFAFLGAVVYYFDSPETLLGTPGKLTEKPKVFPYAVANNASTEYYSNDGVLDYTFNAVRLEHYRVESEQSTDGFEEYTLINEPRIVIFLPEKSWYIQSQSGKITDEGRTITLWDDVKVWQDSAVGTSTKLSTNELKIYPLKKYAETNEPVKIVSRQGYLNAVGMQVNFANKKIKLLSKVRAQHEPF